MRKHIFTGFGFGPIQSGLFAAEAFKSGNFDHIVIAEIDQGLVDAVRKNGGNYCVNIARSNCIEHITVKGIEIYNPAQPEDRFALLDVLAQSTDIATCLPSVDFYDTGDEGSVALLLASSLTQNPTQKRIIYTAENNNHAAERLHEQVERRNPKVTGNVQFLNTVIGKMSQTTKANREIAGYKLQPITPDTDRAFLVEEFNKIMVTRCIQDQFKPGIEVFVEREDLLPFEEAKLYGHNAIHCLLAYIGDREGYTKMAELRHDPEIMNVARKAFIEESGAALLQKYSSLNDPLFTEEGYKEYAEDLLVRMTNPYLDDAIERIGRDPLRKLGVSDRIFGTIQLALQYGIEPIKMAQGAVAGIDYIQKRADEFELPRSLRDADAKDMDEVDIKEWLNWIWQGEEPEHVTVDEITGVMVKTLHI
jgi:mannitol-1-phosphate 5-dehydrogenase